MSKYYKELRAGRYCMAISYSRSTVKDSPKARAEKARHSSKARQVLNDKNSRLQLTSIIAENFADSNTAFWVTGTFDDDHYPDLKKGSEYWDFCVDQGKKYLERLRYLLRKRKTEIKAVHCPGMGEGGRWHVHVLIDGCTEEDLRACWNDGNLDFHRLSGDSKWITDREWKSKKTKNVNPVAIAKYMMENASRRLLGKHPWHATRNCVRPKVQPARVIHDSTDMAPPEGSEIISQECVETLYSSYSFIEYILPAQNRQPHWRRGKRAAPRGA